MTTPTAGPPTIERESERLDALFTPTFDVKVAGSSLPAETMRDIVSVTYDDSVHAMDGFELVVGNGDLAVGAEGRYVGPETEDDLRGSGPDAERYRLFEPSSDEVELSMGYEGEVDVMLTGTIVTLEPEFPARGPAVLRVRGLNALHRLRRKPYSTVWVGKKDSEIATSLGGLTDPETGQARFPLPVRVSDAAQGREAPTPFVVQENQHDIEFLMARAKVHGYVLSVGRDGTAPYLYFGPALGDTARDVVYTLEYGRSLLSFSASLTGVKQVRSLTVRGWDRDANAAVDGTVRYDDSRLDTNRDLDRILERLEARDDILVDREASSAAMAEALALDLLRERRNDFVRASGVTLGLSRLRAGARVVINGVGSRFGGTWFITSTTHTIDSGGYRTAFRARREQERT